MLYSLPGLRVSQCTLSQPAHCSGIGGSGIGLRNRRKIRLSLLPAPAGSGIHILRRDVDIARGLITPAWDNVTDTFPGIELGNQHGVSIRGVEPLLAALRGAGIDNVLIEVSSDEIPQLDGSSAPWLELIHQAGIVAQGVSRQGIWIDHFVAVRSGEHYAFIKPAVMPSITIDMNRAEIRPGQQPLSLSLLDYEFEKEIAPARNPAFAELSDSGLYAATPFTQDREQSRFEDEALRYRALECLGCLALAEAPIFGQLYVYNPSSFLIHLLLAELAEARDTWRVMSYARINQMTGEIAAAAFQKR